MAIGLGPFWTATWARAAGVVIAGLLVLADFLSLPYYPLWPAVTIAFSGFIIWALCVARPEEPPTGTTPRAP